jgi:polyisoprenoid-binding protein YceI
LSAQQSVTSAKIGFVFVSNNVDGTIDGFLSSSKIFPDDLTSSKFEGSVTVNTLKTGNFIRDWHLKSSKYFDEEEYPIITFKSTEVIPIENGLEVIGVLTIKGISKTISWHLQKDGNTLRGSTSVFSSDFNIEIKNEREANEVVITLLLELG